MDNNIDEDWFDKMCQKHEAKNYWKKELETISKTHQLLLVDLLGFGETKRDESIDLAQHAAWTTVASAILNLDEVLSKE